MRTQLLAASVALLSANAALAGEKPAAEKPESAAAAGARSESHKIPDILPLELTAFGDIQYRFQRPMVDEFRIGSLELDAALTLAPYAIAATAIGYDPDTHGMALASFVVDGGLAGEGAHHLWQSPVIQRSGVIVGQFDVARANGWQRRGGRTAAATR